MIIERETSHAALHAAGATTVRQLAPNKFEVFPDIDEADLTTLELSVAKADKLEELKQAASAEVAAIRNQYPGFERETWVDQEREARAWTEANANGTALPDTPTLSGFAEERGVTVADMAARVIDKADQYRDLATSVGGKRQALRDQVNAIDLADYASASDAIAAVEAITW